MEIQIDTELLIKNNLTVSEYLYIRNLVVEDINKINNLFEILDVFNLNRLESKGFIKITKEGIIPREKSKELFNVLDIVDKFIVLFPTKTPINKRYLSPTKLEGVVYSKIKNQWKRIFKNDIAKAEKALKVLEAEIKMRQTTGSMEYMNAIDVWLNQANYDKYEYLLEQNDQNNENSGELYNDWL